MSAQLCPFPVPPEHVAAQAAKKRVAKAARSILRSAAIHNNETLIWACRAMKNHGDWMDHLEADAMLLAISLRTHRQRQDAARDDARRGTIRRELADYIGFALICAAAVMILGWGLW